MQLLSVLFFLILLPPIVGSNKLWNPCAVKLLSDLSIRSVYFHITCVFFLFLNLQCSEYFQFHLRSTEYLPPTRGKVTDWGVRGPGFKSRGSILTSITETSSLSRVVRAGWDPFSVPVNR